MVIRRGNVTWGSNFSSAELHLSEGPLNTNTPEEFTKNASDCWLGRQCPVISNSNPQNQVKWVSEVLNFNLSSLYTKIVQAPFKYSLTNGSSLNFVQHKVDQT